LQKKIRSGGGLFDFPSAATAAGMFQPATAAGMFQPATAAGMFQPATAAGMFQPAIARNNSTQQH